MWRFTTFLSRLSHPAHSLTIYRKQEISPPFQYIGREKRGSYLYTVSLWTIFGLEEKKEQRPFSPRVERTFLPPSLSFDESFRTTTSPFPTTLQRYLSIHPLMGLIEGTSTPCIPKEPVVVFGWVFRDVQINRFFCDVWKGICQRKRDTYEWDTHTHRGGDWFIERAIDSIIQLFSHLNKCYKLLSVCISRQCCG